MSARILVVRHLGREVGTITRTTDGALRFAYAEGWLTSKGSFALASSLPLERGIVETPFFGNLLPEGGARQRIAGMAGISPENDFELLRVFGADCAGSLSITDPDEPTRSGVDGAAVITLHDDDGPKLATKAGFASFFRPERRVRLSLAGAQHKLAVVKTDDGLAIPLDGRPSTHILKLPNPDFKGLVENEAIVLSLAAELGLPVVEHEIVPLGDARMLLIERYDRQVEGGVVTRLHQQDLCQATGLPPDIKYENEGGPSLKTVFDVMRDEVQDPLAATTALLDWVVFNVLVHNADAHAKNISLLRSATGEQTLAPFYDLVCTGTYDLDHRMAMAIGGQLEPGAIARESWVAFAADVDIGKNLVFRTIERIGERLPEVLDEQLGTLGARLGRIPRRQQLERTIKRRVKKSLALLG